MRRQATQSKPDLARAFTPAMTRPRLPVWLLAVVLALVTITLYWPATRCGFVNLDDNVNVTSDVHVVNGLNWESIKWALLNPMANNWQPLTSWSHMAVCQVCGLNPWGHHLANVLLHALNAGLVFALLQRMTGASWRSLSVAALFAVHPLRVESVAWVTERKDVLSAFFGLLALMAYARYAQRRMQNAECRMQNAESSDTQHATRNTQHVSRLHALSSLPLLLRLRLDEQANAGDVAVCDATARLLAARENAEGSAIRSATRNTQHATRLTLHVSRFPLPRKAPFLRPGSGGERRDLPGAEAYRRSGGK